MMIGARTAALAKAGGGGNIPSGFYVDYIEGTGSQYIKTGIYPNPRWQKFEIDLELTQDINSTGGVVGCRRDKILNNYSCNILSWISSWANSGINNTNLVGRPCFRIDSSIVKNTTSNYNSEFIVSKDERIKISTCSRKFELNGVLYEIYYVDNKADVVLPYEMYIFTFNNAGTPMEKFLIGKVYDFRFFEDGKNLSNWFRPAVDGNGVVCMWDEITQMFHYNAGSGNFIAGPKSTK